MATQNGGGYKPPPSAFATRCDCLLMFMLLVLFVLMPPLPVLALALSVELVVIHVGLVLEVQPVPVSLIFSLVPVVIVVMLIVVNPSFFLLVPFVLVLRRRHGQSPDWRHQRGRKKHRRNISIPTMHICPPGICPAKQLNSDALPRALVGSNLLAI